MKSQDLFAYRNEVTRWIRWFGILLSINLLPNIETAQAQVTVSQGGTLLDGTGAPPRQNVVIVVRGDRIERIGSGGQTPTGATVMDMTGKYVLPGLIDTHLHYKDWFPELLISNGVTSVLGYGGGPWLNLQSEGIAKGKILGPRLFLSQGMIGSGDSRPPASRLGYHEYRLRVRQV